MGHAGVLHWRGRVCHQFCMNLCYKRLVAVSMYNHIKIAVSMCKQTLHHSTWWRHQIETFSVLLALCLGNSMVTRKFPAQRPVTRSFGVFFDSRLNKRLSKQSRFETSPRVLWRRCNDEAKMDTLCNHYQSMGINIVTKSVAQEICVGFYLNEILVNQGRILATNHTNTLSWIPYVNVGNCMTESNNRATTDLEDRLYIL